MWVMTNRFFVSIVEHKDNPKLLVVRGRLPGHVAEFLGVDREDETITPQADYRYRIFTTRAKVEAAAKRAAKAIDYTSVKSTTMAPALHSAALQCWQVWNNAQWDFHNPIRPLPEPHLPSWSNVGEPGDGLGFADYDRDDLGKY